MTAEADCTASVGIIQWKAAGEVWDLDALPDEVPFVRRRGKGAQPLLVIVELWRYRGRTQLTCMTPNGSLLTFVGPHQVRAIGPAGCLACELLAAALEDSTSEIVADASSFRPVRRRPSFCT